MVTTGSALRDAAIITFLPFQRSMRAPENRPEEYSVASNADDAIAAPIR